MNTGNLPKDEQVQNEVFLDKQGFIHIIYHGEQTKAKMQLQLHRTKKFIDKLMQEGKPVYILADIRGVGKHTNDARMIGLRASAHTPFQRAAIIISDVDRRTARIAKLITKMSGRKKAIGYFYSEEAAANWLMGLAQTAQVAEYSEDIDLLGRDKTPPSLPA